MKRLDLYDRMVIQACLLKEFTLNEIAQRIGVNKSTISRELAKYSVVKQGLTNKQCPKIKKHVVCNTCKTKGYCRLTRRFYNFEEAQKNSMFLRKSSRQYSKLSEEEIETFNLILLEQVRGLKQSLHHVWISNSCINSRICERTLRRTIQKGVFDVKASELRKFYVKSKKYKEGIRCRLRSLEVLVGRTFRDFDEYCTNHKKAHIVEFDSVIGKITDKKAILTITFPKEAFQFGILIVKESPDSVEYKIKKLFAAIGSEVVKRIFEVCLADNGIEFSKFPNIEIDENGEKICSTFFTNPYRATDKPHCERYHEYVRYILPKGKSLDGLDQETVNFVFSQTNSFVRKSIKDKTPYELIEKKYGKEFLDLIGVQKIEKKKVNLTPII